MDISNFGSTFTFVCILIMILAVAVDDAIIFNGIRSIKKFDFVLPILCMLIGVARLILNIAGGESYLMDILWILVWGSNLVLAIFRMKNPKR